MQLSDIQPQYFPRLHYFARMLSSDIFVLRDDVQFVRNHKYPDGKRGVSFQAHTPVKAGDGVQMLALCVKKGGLAPIRETEVAYDQPWMRKHINVLKNHYSKAPNVKRLIPEIEMLFDQRFDTVGQLNIATLCWALSRILGAEVVKPESLSIDSVNHALSEHPATRLRQIAMGSDNLSHEKNDSSTATERIAALCRTFGADIYLAGGTAFQSYMNIGVFESEGIKVAIQDWTCPLYRQQYEQHGFIANLSIIDLLMNVGSRELLSILT
jgi:hypothetical protein